MGGHGGAGSGNDAQFPDIGKRGTGVRYMEGSGGYSMMVV